jgi:COP9 signalosome complex subunit 6
VQANIGIFANIARVPATLRLFDSFFMTLLVKLHPSVLLNISDHFTTNKSNNLTVIGCLYGKQEGQNIEILNSFELIVNNDTLDKEFLSSKQKLVQEMFPNLEFLGWYGLGKFPLDSDLKYHQQLYHINEFPLFLQFDPEFPDPKTIPVKIYESIVNPQTAKIEFSQVSFKITLFEAERIALDHINNSSMSQDKNKVAENLMIQKSTF